MKVATDEAVSLYFAISSLFTIIEAQHASNNIAFEHLGIYISDALSLLRYSSNEQVIDLTIEDSSDEVVTWQPARITKRKRLAPLPAAHQAPSSCLYRNPSQRSVLSDLHQRRSRKTVSNCHTNTRDMELRSMCCLKRPAGHYSTEASHEFQEKRSLVAHRLETAGPNNVDGSALRVQVPGAIIMKNTPYGTDRKHTVAGTSESKDQASVDLSLVGPGESIRPRKRTRDGRLKASSPSSKWTTERSGNPMSSDGQYPAQLVSEADQQSESEADQDSGDTGAIMFQAAPESRGPTTGIKATAPAKTWTKSLRKKPSLKNLQDTRHQAPSHRSPSSSSADEQILGHHTPLAPQKTYSTSQSSSSLLRLRELGHGGKSSWFDTDGASSQLRSRRFNSLKPWRTWTGASNDVMVLAWSPDGQSYAAGASAQTDESSMMYNRPNNLLYGSLPKDTMWELPDHRIDRPLPATGPNSDRRTYDACDPDLYMSVTSVCFSASGNHMYSASYDETVKVWDTSGEGRLLCSDTLVHDAQVEVMALSSYDNEYLATGSRLVNDAIRVYKLTEDGSVLNYSTLSSLKAQTTPALEIYPSCLQWGLGSFSRHLLLAGFSESKDQADSHDPGKVGDLCLWDLINEKPMEVIPRTQNVFDIAWHQTLPVFAVGTVLRLGHISDRSCRSAVRIYEPFRMSGCTVEFECPALDINDVSFCPTDSHYVTAGCTNGVTYVWDYRKPETVVHQLEHGLPIAPMKPDMTREQSDTGIRLTAWADFGSHFYTGSSDGIIKRWNIKLAPEDVHIEDVAQFEAGIMCGQFSPDSTNLLVGDARGSVHILSTAPVLPYDDDLDNEKAIRYQHARGNNDAAIPDDDNPSADAARAVVTSDEIVIHPLWGAGQGPKHRGPYASYAREEGADPRTEPLLPKYQAQQLDSGQRALAARAGVWAEPAEQKLIAVQHELARARNLKVVKEELLQTQFAIRLSPEKRHQETLQNHSPSTRQRHQQETRPIQKKSANQLSSTSENHQYVQSSTRHNTKSKGQQGATSQLSTVSAVHRMMQLSEKHKVAARKIIVISSDESNDSD